MSNMKCPFCGKKLWYDEQDGIYRCMKSECFMDYEGGTEKLWQELIRTQKALDVAVNALNRIDKQLMTVIEMTSEARNALEQITALEQKD